MAYAGRSRSDGYPEVMYNSPLAANGVGPANVAMPASSHSSAPSRPYDRTPLVPAVTISVRLSFFHTNGVTQFVPVGRSTRHISSPLAVLNAAMNDRSSLSLTMNRRSPKR